MTPDEVLAAHPHLTLAQVHAALAYFYDHRQEIEWGAEELVVIEQELRARFPSASHPRSRSRPHLSVPAELSCRVAHATGTGPTAVC